MTGEDHHSNDAVLLQLRTSPPPNQMIAQHIWNESAEPEKQFDTHFVEMRVMTSGSGAIKTESKR